jgi:hypothetical protein
MANIVSDDKINCNTLNSDKRSSTSISDELSWEKVEWNLKQHYFNSLSSNDFNFRESYKNQKLSSNVFNSSNLFFKEVIVISTTIKKYSTLNDSCGVAVLGP